MREEFFNFGVGGGGVLVADAVAGNVAGEFVEAEGYGEALFAGHGAIHFDLFGECLVGVHAERMPGFSARARVSRAVQ